MVITSNSPLDDTDIFDPKVHTGAQQDINKLTLRLVYINCFL